MAKHILTIEDDPDILFIIEHILKEEGFSVFTSTEGKNILDKVGL